MRDVSLDPLPLRSRLFQALAVSLVLAATLTLFEPLKGALLNWEELTLGGVDLLRLLAQPFLLTALLLGAVALVGALVLPRRFVPIWAALLVAVWAQGTFFVLSYGPFDGTPIDWSQHALLGWVEAALWLALLLFAGLRPTFFRREAGAVAAGVLLLQLLSLGGSWAQVRPLSEKQTARSAAARAADGRALGAALTTFSREQNVIVIVLDTFQSDFFAELMGDPEFAVELPPGFTFYRNAVAVYPTTELGLQNILTSATFEDAADLHRWRINQMRRSVAARLARQGWDATLLTWTPRLIGCNAKNTDYRCISHAALLPYFYAEIGQARRVNRDHADETRELLGIASFRLAPHLLKPWVYNGGSWRVPELYGEDQTPAAIDPRIRVWTRRDLAILGALVNLAFAADIAPTFKFLHFFGVHTPTSVTRACEWNGLKRRGAGRRGRYQRKREYYRTRGPGVETAGCILSLVSDFLWKLDELGVYDGSLVLVLGDHGRFLLPVDASFASPPISNADPGGAGTKSSQGVPLFLVKRAGQRGPLRVSDAPVSLCDVPKTILDELGLSQEGLACRSVFGVATDRPRRRIHYQKHESKKDEPFGQYIVDGHAWLDSSWSLRPGVASAEK